MGSKHNRKPASAKLAKLSSTSLPKSSGAGSGAMSKPINANVEAKVAETVQAKGGKDKVVEPLAFRSWKTGTLDSSAFQPTGYTPKKIHPISSTPAVAEMKLPGGVSSIQKVSSTPQKVSDGVKKITTLIQEMQRVPYPNVTRLDIHRTDSNTPQGSVDSKGPGAGSHTTMKSSSYFQIVVDLRENSTAFKAVSKQGGEVKGKEIVSQDSINDQITKFGKDFSTHATRVTIDLIFPTPAEGSVAIRAYGQANKSGAHTKTDFSLAINTAGFKVLEELVAKLDKCINMKILEVIIHNPTASGTEPFTVEQLMYGLPFYDLRFEKWEMKWKSTVMTRPIDVGRFSLSILDKERNKWLWATKKAEKEAEHAAWKEQQRVDNMVFVTPSVAPQWQRLSHLPQPFPTITQAVPVVPQSFPALPQPFPASFPAPPEISLSKDNAQGKK